MSESAFEQFKERMKRAAAQIAQIKKEEGKQKKKEAELLKILLRFVKKSQKKELVLLISRDLEQNIQPNFVLAIIVLGNEEIKQALGGCLMLQGSVQEPEKLEGEKDEKSKESLTFFNKEDESLPLKIKIELDDWVKSLLLQASEKPQKLLDTAYQVEKIKIEDDTVFSETKYKVKKTIKQVTIQLIAFVLRDYFEQKDLEEDYEKLQEFAEFILKGILTKTQESIDNRKFLAGDSDVDKINIEDYS